MDLIGLLKKFFNIPNVGDTTENKGECVGLVMTYTDSLGLPHTWGHAKDLLKNADPNQFAITYNNLNDINQFPVSGSIMVWGDTWGKGYGHTGVVIFADGKLFSTLEQNNPVGHAPQTIMHDYKGVIGWFTPKNLPSVPTAEELNACMADRDNLWKQRDDVLKQVEEVKKQLDEANQKLTSFAALGYATTDDINKRLDDKDKTIQGLQTEVQQVLDRNGKLAEMVTQKEKEDSTAIDDGRQAQLRVVELERQLQMIAMETKSKPNSNAILSSIDALKQVAAWGEKILKAKEKADAKEKPEKKSDPFEFLLSLFGLRGGA